MLYPNSKRPRTSKEIKLVFEAVKQALPDAKCCEPRIKQDQSCGFQELNQPLLIGNVQFSILLSL